VGFSAGIDNFIFTTVVSLNGDGPVLPDNEEIDFTVDFHPTTGPFEGAWLRVRYGILNPGSSRKRYNVRITLNWGFQLL